MLLFQRQIDKRGRAVFAGKHVSPIGALSQMARALADEREQVARTVSPDVSELFQRVAKLRGVAVAAARDGRCQECHLLLRLQMYSELKRNDAITQCPQCNRILYYEPPAPVAATEP